MLARQEFHDLSVLQGAEVTLKEMRPLVYSENQLSRQAGVNEWMAARGYLPFALDHPDHAGSRTPGDFLFVPAEIQRVHVAWFGREPKGVALNVLVTGFDSAAELHSNATVFTNSGQYGFTFSGTRTYRDLPNRFEDGDVHWVVIDVRPHR